MSCVGSDESNAVKNDRLASVVRSQDGSVRGTNKNGPLALARRIQGMGTAGGQRTRSRPHLSRQTTSRSMLCHSESPVGVKNDERYTTIALSP